MNRSKTFTLRMSRAEREMLERLAEYFQRSQSDIVRVLVREASAQLELENGQALATVEGNREHCG